MKTSQVAETLKISSKTVLSIAKKLNIVPTKNEFGHNIFSEQDVLRMTEYVPERHTRVAITTTGKKNDELEQLTEKFSTLERQLREINLDTVQYQLLQHRREIEELRDENKSLRNQLEKLEQSILEKKATDEQVIKESTSPSFFSFLFRSKEA